MSLSKFLVVVVSCFVSSSSFFFQVVSSQEYYSEEGYESYANEVSEQQHDNIYDDPYTLNPEEYCWKKVNMIVSIVFGIIFGIFVTIFPAIYISFLPRAKFAKQVITGKISTECVVANVIHVDKKWISSGDNGGGSYEYTPTVQFIITKEDEKQEPEEIEITETNDGVDEEVELQTAQPRQQQQRPSKGQNKYEVIGVLPKQHYKPKQQIELLVSTENFEMFETKYQLNYDGGPKYKHFLCNCGSIIMISIGLLSGTGCVALTLVGTRCFIMPLLTFVIIPFLGCYFSKWYSQRKEESNPNNTTFRSTNVTITKL